MSDSLATWTKQAGSTSQLYALVASVITKVAPDIILTFDYRHGSTCHPDHEATGYIVLQAANTIKFPAASIFVDENSFAMGTNWIGLNTVIPGDPAVQIFNASTNWAAFSHDFSLNSSQFTGSEIAAASNSPANAKIMSLMTSGKMKANDPLYDALCR